MGMEPLVFAFLAGVVVGLLLAMSARWIGKKLSRKLEKRKEGR